jgi:hypothetical protein
MGSLSLSSTEFVKKLVPSLAFLLLAGRGAAAQTPATQIPWNAPPATASALLVQAGFARAGADTAATYTRSASGVVEQLYVRTRAAEHWSVTYSAVGDSAALQAKLDAAAAGQSASAGPGEVQGTLRVWTMAGGRRLALPTHPFRLPGGAAYQFMAVYSRP